MKLLVFGRNGQVARELVRCAPADVEVICLGRSEVDLEIEGAGAAAVSARAPDAVINAAAWTAVDQAEDEVDRAQRLNADAPGELARACAIAALPFLHVSTDYVFDGSGSAPWMPDAMPAPASTYGRSKLAGEAAVLAACPDALVLRTSWVFSAHGSNFVKTMLRLSAERTELRIVADQFGGPTSAAAIARALHSMVAARLTRPGEGGVYHFSGAPEVNWADFAEAIFARAGRSVRVERITSDEYPTRAVRPRNSRLDCSTTEARFGLPRPSWETELDAVLDELMNQGA